jgi:hypothetical protein
MLGKNLRFFVVSALLIAVGVSAVAQAARPPIPAGSRELAPGQLPRQCVAGDEAGGTINAYGSNYGVYFSKKANTWVSAPFCYPRWGNLEASASQIVKGGATATVTAIPTDGSNSGQYAPETKSITWRYPGTVVAGCGAADLTCSVKIPKNETEEWQWHEFHVTMPRTFFIDSRGSNCAGQHLCAGFATNAWSFVGVKPGGTDSEISGRVSEVSCDAAASVCKRRALSGVRLVASGGPGGPQEATTDAAGDYAIDVKKGTWRVTPSLGSRRFEEKFEIVSVAGKKRGVDFLTCALPEDDADDAEKTETANKPLVCPPNGIDWQMPSRLADQVPQWSSGSDDQPLPRSAVYPKKWRVNLFLTHKGTRLEQCAKGDRWKWTVTPPAGAKVLTKPAIGCSPHMIVSDLGTYLVRAENLSTGDLLPRSGPQKVVAKDWLIVGVGDSNGSGEGNPSFQVRRCARGVTSYQYQTAEYIEEQDDHASVTFVFASCSGASVAHLYKTPYRGTVKNERVPLSPQLDQVARIIATRQGVPGEPQSGEGRKVDALLVSIGVNDLAFGPVLSTCVKVGLAQVVPGVVNADCFDFPVRTTFDARNGVNELTITSAGDPTLRDAVAGFQADLPGRYKALRAAFARSPLSPGVGGLGLTDMDRAFFTQYPDFSSSDAIVPCDTTAAAAVPKWRPATWAWLQEQSVLLNQNVKRGAASIGARTAEIPTELWQRHGYCATESWFVPVGEAVLKDDITGPFHPNVTGHTIEAQFNSRAVCRELLGKADCRGRGQRRPGPARW